MPEAFEIGHVVEDYTRFSTNGPPAFKSIATTHNNKRRRRKERKQHTLKKNQKQSIKHKHIW